MVEGLWLLTKADVDTSNKRTINGITAALMNGDDAQTEAQIKVAAAARLVVGGHAVQSDYFTSAVLVSNLTAGVLKDNLDIYIFGDRPSTIIEGP